MNNFVHLNLHTEFSIVDGIVRIPALFEKLTALNMPAAALTDQSNLFAVVKFYRAAISAGIKPIIGADIYLENAESAKNPYHLLLLCQNEAGYKNLMEILSRAYLENQQFGKPLVQKSWVLEKNDGLIALSGGLAGDVGEAILDGKKALAQERLGQWIRHFPNRFYLEIQRIGHEKELVYNRAALSLARENKLPVVATNAVRFLNADDFEAHEARVCIHDGWQLEDSKRPKCYTDRQYLRTKEEMAELFQDMPEALQNTVEIAKRCNVKLPLGKLFLPNFSLPSSADVESYFEKAAREGLEERLDQLLDRNAADFNEKRKAYDERLEIELAVIKQMGFPGYFLIVSDFVKWAKDQNIPVGPGRGSGSGSLVAYSLKITDVDPLHYHLLFERFLNPERVSMPDFDIDFCIKGRDRVIDYVRQKYGHENTAQIITYGTMAARAVVRDVGRVLGHPYGYVDKIAKLIPFQLGITLNKALEEDDALRDLYEKEDEVKTLINLAKKLEGVTRNAGKHAAGVVIAPSKLTDFTPIYCEEDDTQTIVTHLDKDDLEAVGLVKFDFLGLRNLTIIKHAVDIINAEKSKKGEPLIDIDKIPLNDGDVFALLQNCQTTGVFQLESRGIKDLIKRLKPDCLEDMIALVALYRPGPLQSGMVDDFVKRKHGEAEIAYLHPKLEKVLKPTYGVIVYQEQVMQIARILAGYSLGGADILRRAMGKKKPKEMQKQRKIFMEGAAKNQINLDTATHIFDLMEKFSAYGFPQAHSTTYAIIAYQTAWLKAHYPSEYMAALLSADMDNTDKVIRFLEESRAMGIEIIPPNVNRSEMEFTVENGKIIYGLGAIKGVGESAAGMIADNRKEHGEFADLFDFCCRLDSRKINRKTLEALIKAGAFDGVGDAPSRASLFASVDLALKAAGREELNRLAKQGDLFGDMETQTAKLQYKKATAWSQKKQLQAEKEALGHYLGGHPIEPYLSELKAFGYVQSERLNEYVGRTAKMAGWVAGLRTTQTKRGDRMAFVRLSDLSGQIEVAIFSDAYAEYRSLLQKDQLLLVEGDINPDEYTGGIRVSARKLWDIAGIRQQFAKYLLIKVRAKDVDSDFIKRLKIILQKNNCGGCPVRISYEKENTKALLPLGDEWTIRPTDECLQQLKDTFPQAALEVCY